MRKRESCSVLSQAAESSSATETAATPHLLIMKEK
jgi:hypothetical protein